MSIERAELAPEMQLSTSPVGETAKVIELYPEGPEKTNEDEHEAVFDGLLNIYNEYRPGNHPAEMRLPQVEINISKYASGKVESSVILCPATILPGPPESLDEVDGFNLILREYGAWGEYLSGESLTFSQGQEGCKYTDAALATITQAAKNSELNPKLANNKEPS